MSIFYSKYHLLLLKYCGIFYIFNGIYLIIAQYVMGYMNLGELDIDIFIFGTLNRFFFMSILSIAGGIHIMYRRNYGVAIIGSICNLFVLQSAFLLTLCLFYVGPTLILLGIPVGLFAIILCIIPIIIVVKAKNEFKSTKKKRLR